MSKLKWLLFAVLIQYTERIVTIMSIKNVSGPVIRRLPRYYRYLSDLSKRNITRISSGALAAIMHLTPSQIRQDFNCFGGFGQQGYGYNVNALLKEMGDILGIGNNFKAILIGAGNLGSALINKHDLQGSGFLLEAIFDNAPEKVGQVIQGITVQDIAALEEYCERERPSTAILCMTAGVAEEIVDRLIKCGVGAFWNFTQVDIEMQNKGIIVENVHLTDSLMTLCYHIADSKSKES